jgi:hypothetical protein
VPAGLGFVTQVAAGAQHTLALLDSGDVVAFGSNAYGQCSVPGTVGIAAGIAAGAYHSLADRQGVSNTFCLGDLNFDRVVDGGDLGILLSAWGPAPDSAADLTGDGVVDGDDLGQMLGAWGPCG